MSRASTTMTTAKFGIALLLACSCSWSIILLSSGSSALLTPSIPRTSSFLSSSSALSMSSSMDQGWDNDNFLDSLGRGNSDNDNDNGSDAMDRANDEYYDQSKYGRPVAVEIEESSAVNSYSTGLSYADSLQQQQPPPTSYINNNDNMASMSDAAAEIYAYSYNKDAPVVAGTSFTSPSGDTTAALPQQPSNNEGGIATEPALSKDLVAKAMSSHNDEEEASQGGSRFRQLMERAKGVEQQELQQSYQQQLQQQQQQQRMMQNNNPMITDNSITPPSSIMTPEEIATLSIEEQARLYREFFYVQQHKKLGANAQSQQTQQQAPLSIGSTATNYLDAGIGFDGRKIGSNRDADAVSNAGDAYFAQLKRDSTTRNLARYSGDHQKANEIFHDPAIQDIKAPVNPYLIDQQKRMRDVVETVPEEMLLFQEYEDPNDSLSAEELAAHTGVSYKQKFEQKKLEREQEQRNNY